MAETTEYFAQKRLNFHPINFIWKPNEKYNLEADAAIKEAMFEVDEGVVKKYTALRMKELDQNVNTTCFKNKELSYAQALKCEQFLVDNDYKLNNLRNFSKDYMWKYALEYHNCYNSPDFDALPSIEEKDRKYDQCHKKLVKQMKETVVPELTEIAKKVFE